MPYCDTESNPDFHTSVTSQAFVACSLQERKADTAFPPTTEHDISFHPAKTIDLHGSTPTDWATGGRCDHATGVDLTDLIRFLTVVEMEPFCARDIPQ